MALFESSSPQYLQCTLYLDSDVFRFVDYSTLEFMTMRFTFILGDHTTTCCPLHEKDHEYLCRFRQVIECGCKHPRIQAVRHCFIFNSMCWSTVSKQDCSNTLHNMPPCALHNYYILRSPVSYLSFILFVGHTM